MRDLGAEFRRDERGEAGIAEEVEERWAPSPAAHQPLAHERPMRLLLGERADMAEGGEAAGKADRAVPADPGFFEAGAPLPAPGAFLVDVAGEDGVGPLPVGGRQAAASRSPAPRGGRASAPRNARAFGRGRNRSAHNRRALWSSGRAAWRSCRSVRRGARRGRAARAAPDRRRRGNKDSRSRASWRRRPCRSAAACLRA